MQYLPIYSNSDGLKEKVHFSGQPNPRVILFGDGERTWKLKLNLLLDKTWTYGLQFEH